MKRLLIMFISMVMALCAIATAEAEQPRRSERNVQGSFGQYLGPPADSGDTPIQPGAAVRLYPGPNFPAALRPLLDTPFGVCTLNFVFQGRNPKHIYIGGAGHCLPKAGERVEAPGIGAFGTVAFRVNCRDEPCSDRPVMDDFALIRIDTNKHHMVSPVMRGLGRAPSGFTTSEETAAGDRLLLHGQGMPFSLVEPGRTQEGLLDHDDPLSFASTLQGRSHSGSPVVRLPDGKALGIIATTRSPAALHGAPIAAGEALLLGGPTVEHLMELLDEAGFALRLVTGDRPWPGSAAR